MKRTVLSILVFLATTASASGAETTNRAESLPDSNPECMDRNGPDCVLQGATVPSRGSAPPITEVKPPLVVPPVVVPPAVLNVVSPGIPDWAAPRPQSPGFAEAPAKPVASPPAQGTVIVVPQFK